MTIFLIGPMGAGKTAIGRQLSRLLNFNFYDSDHAIQERTGVDIAFIFEKEGEAGFRKREQQMLDELSQLNNSVVATGGGAILAQKTRYILKQRGTVIYLHASVKTQLARIRRGRHRPLLDIPEPHSRLAEIFALRDPLYRATAHHTVFTDDHRVPAVARKIQTLLNCSQ